MREREFLLEKRLGVRQWVSIYRQEVVTWLLVPALIRHKQTLFGRGIQGVVASCAEKGLEESFFTFLHLEVVTIPYYSKHGRKVHCLGT